MKGCAISWQLMRGIPDMHAPLANAQLNTPSVAKWRANIGKQGCSWAVRVQTPVVTHMRIPSFGSNGHLLTPNHIQATDGTSIPAAGNSKYDHSDQGLYFGRAFHALCLTKLRIWSPVLVTTGRHPFATPSWLILGPAPAIYAYGHMGTAPHPH